MRINAILVQFSSLECVSTWMSVYHFRWSKSMGASIVNIDPTSFWRKSHPQTLLVEIGPRFQVPSVRINVPVHTHVTFAPSIQVHTQVSELHAGTFYLDKARRTKSKNRQHALFYREECQKVPNHSLWMVWSSVFNSFQLYLSQTKILEGWTNISDCIVTILQWWAYKTQQQNRTREMCHARDAARLMFSFVTILQWWAYKTQQATNNMRHASCSSDVFFCNNIYAPQTKILERWTKDEMWIFDWRFNGS